MRPLIFRILYFLRILKLFPQFYFHYQVKKYVKRGDTVIDIGANQGIYTRIFSDLGAEVYAVEPLDIFWDSLYEIPNITICPVALGDRNKTIQMEQWRNTSGAYKINENGSFYARKVKGSWLFAELGKINFIKIDVEGSELPIIEDMAELILKHKPTILIETGQIDKVLHFLPSYKVIDSLNNDYLIRE